MFIMFVKQTLNSFKLEHRYIQHRYFEHRYIQHRYIQHKYIQHKYIQHKYIQHKYIQHRHFEHKYTLNTNILWIQTYFEYKHTLKFLIHWIWWNWINWFRNTKSYLNTCFWLAKLNRLDSKHKMIKCKTLFIIILSMNNKIPHSVWWFDTWIHREVQFN